MRFSPAYARGWSPVKGGCPSDHVGRGGGASSTGEGGGASSGQSIYMLNEQGHAADFVNAESEHSGAPMFASAAWSTSAA